MLGKGSSRECIAELAAKDFSRGCAGYGVDKAHFAGLFVMGQPVGDESSKLQIESVTSEVAVANHNKGARNFTRSKIGLSHHAAIQDCGMLEQDRFNFRRSYGEAFVLNHFFTAVEDVVETIFIGANDIAGVIPAIAQGSLSRSWLFPVAKHELRSAHEQLSGFAGSDFLTIYVQDAALRKSQRLTDRGWTMPVGRRDETDMGDR